MRGSRDLPLEVHSSLGTGVPATRILEAPQKRALCLSEQELRLESLGQGGSIDTPVIRSGGTAETPHSIPLELRNAGRPAVRPRHPPGG